MRRSDCCFGEVIDYYDDEDILVCSECGNKCELAEEETNVLMVNGEAMLWVGKPYIDALKQSVNPIRRVTKRREKNHIITEAFRNGNLLYVIEKKDNKTRYFIKL